MAKRRKGSGALHVVVGLLLASALIRTVTEAGPALAQATQVGIADVQVTAPAADKEASFFAALQAREAGLNAREAQINAKLELMQAAQVELDEQLSALTSAEVALSATIAMAEAASQTDVAQLTSVYENMKPKEAAALFEEMPPEFAAGFLGLMRPDMAASIMTELAPETAYSFSVVLAGRNADTPLE
jgi:flagellar motility protein MotE (MotC chaperone)